MLDAVLFGKGASKMQTRQEKGRQLTREDMVLILLVVGTVLLAIWIGNQIL